ncbi:MAG: hypothetical protein ACYCOU_05480 [Sulfobacillus sp.]
MEFICAVLNRTEGAEETSNKLAQLVTEWQESGPNLAKMMAKPANVPLWRTLAKSCNATWTITKTGGASIHLEPGIALPEFGHSRTRTEEKEAKAKILFYKLTLGPWEKLGGPCPRCGKYFIRKRANHKSYCGRRCGSLASAEASTRKKLNEDRAKLLGLAVKFWPQWTERKHPIRALWIAEKVNAKRGTERHITQKWISRNIDIRTGKVKGATNGTRKN